MIADSAGWLATPAFRILLRTTLYYVVLFGIAAISWRTVPVSELVGDASLEALLEPRSNARDAAETQLLKPEPLRSAGNVLVATLAALLLSLPVAWIYQLTRTKRGYQQAVVQLLVILPIVVSGIVVLVKHSVALAFSLAGIVAAVRFRNTLDDSKDAVYVFLATGLGLAAAVDVVVAAVLSVVFNTTIVALWFADFGHSPVELEGRIAQRRLSRARQLSQTGTFVAQVDAELLRNMNPEQLEGLAERAWRRAHDTKGSNLTTEFRLPTRLHIHAANPKRVRPLVEAQLKQHTKDFRLADGDSGGDTLVYVVQLKNKTDPSDLVALLRTAGGPDIMEVELK